VVAISRAAFSGALTVLASFLIGLLVTAAFGDPVAAGNVSIRCNIDANSRLVG
jgi:hypothetical protein